MINIKLLWSSALIILFTVSCKEPTEVINERDPAEKSEVASSQAFSLPRSSANSDRKKYMGMLYFLWHCEAERNVRDIDRILKTHQISGFDNAVSFLNSTRVKQNFNQPNYFGGPGQYHWWGEPEGGYYCLADNDAKLRRHAQQLAALGIDYVVLDITNWPNVKSFNAKEAILDPLKALLRVWSTIPNAPKVVPWVPFQKYNAGVPANERSLGSMLGTVLGILKGQYPNMRFSPQGRPMVARTDNLATYSNTTQRDYFMDRYAKEWHVLPMWGGGEWKVRGTNKWSFLSFCENSAAFSGSGGRIPCKQQSSNVMVSVTAGYQQGYYTNQDAVRKFYGATLVQQFGEVWRNTTAPFVLITGWNEWVAQLIPSGSGNSTRYNFVDLFDRDRNRDIEPGGYLQDYYYRLTGKLIADYRSGRPFNPTAYILDRVNIFDHRYYAKKYPAVAQAVGTSWAALHNHWTTYGINEGRNPSVFFSFSYYRDALGVANISNQGLLDHFIIEGFYENRRGSNEGFAHNYLLKNKDLKAAFQPRGGGPQAYGPAGRLDALRHWITMGYREKGRVAP